MIKNYIKSAWRSLLHNKTFSIINILGLALGLTCSLLILFWVRNQESVDAFHKNGKDLYQVYERNYSDGKVDADYPTQGLLAQELQRNIPDVKFASGFESASAPGSKSTFEAGDKVDQMDGYFAGGDFLRMFSFPVLEGTKDAITNPSTIAISRRMADIFFGSPEKAIGKSLEFENKENLTVTAVFENVPGNSSLQFDFLRSWKDFVAQNPWVNNWGNTDPQTFIELRSDARPLAVESKIKDFLYRYQPKTRGLVTELGLQPFTQRFLYSNFKNGYIDGGRIEYVRLFSLIAIIILLIACINFMNLSTARSAHRAKEVGIRKVMGARRFSLIKQFIGEAMMITLFAVVLALILVVLALPAFSQLTSTQITLPFRDPVFWGMLGGLILVTGLVAGSYPAFFMSNFRTIRVLKGTLKFSGTDIFLRKGLVVLQFALSVILIIATLVIYKQMQYVHNKDLGYNRDHLLYIPIEGNLANEFEVFKQEALTSSAILEVSKMRNSPTIIEHHTSSISWPGKDPNLNVSFADGIVGYDFVKTLGLQLQAGRDFSRSFNDSASFLLNETAVKKIGFTHPIGQTVTWGRHEGTVVGVIKDFNFNSLHQKIEPLIIHLDEGWTWGTILVRLKAGQTQQAIAALQGICTTLNPKFPFTFSFSDLKYNNLYKGEEVISKLSKLFAFLAIFISSLGLFGLAIFTAEQKTKEIGIRKVLGATSLQVVRLLTSYFLKPIALAFVIAFPIAWWAVEKWLQGYAYRIHLGWWIFVVAGLTAIIIALTTISFQAIRAALANPVESLRTE